MLNEMKHYKNWVAFELRQTDNRLSKMPYNPTTGRAAEANNPKTWGDYEQAFNFASELSKSKGLELGRECGIGFEFDNSPFAGIDLDHCIDDNGNLADWAADIIEIMNSYTEYSPSGKGLHIIFKGEILKELADAKKQGTKAENIELYYGGRYFTVTEKPYGQQKPIADASERAKIVFKKYLTKNTEANFSDADLLQAMFSNPKNGDKIRRLYNGDITGYPSPSEANLALCNHLAYYTKNDAVRMDKIFRTSGLMRDKWDEVHSKGKTYGEVTILKALEGKKTDIIKADTAKTDIAKIDFSKASNLSYLDGFLKSLEINKTQAIPTGFENLDVILDGGLYPGLYVFGANSSLGKTSFILQIADNIAKSGRGVLFFSLEMSRGELMAKSLSRLSFIKSFELYRDTSYAQTTRDILLNKYSKIKQAVIDAYKESAENLYVLEGIGDIGVEQIASNVKDYADYKNTAPVVIVDYMQILSPFDIKLNDKQNVDRNVVELKRLSRDYSIPVIGISSFNRENYKMPVSMASFKESGAIEYSSDVLIGMQYKGWDFEEKDSADKERQKRLRELSDKINAQAKAREAQAIQLKILKNRNGLRTDTFFDYYSYANYFIPKA